MLHREVEYRKMMEVEDQHWWFRALHRATLSRLEAHFGARRDIAVLDAGCGTGGMLEALRRAGYRNLTGADLSSYAVDASRERGFEVHLCDVRNLAEHFAGRAFDAIVMNDVACYVPIADWPGIFEGYRRILGPRGIIVLNMPALRAFRGMHDLACGVPYRIDRRDLDAMCDARSYERDPEIYWPFLPSPLVFAARLLQRVKLALRPSAPLVSDVKMPGHLVNAVLDAAMWCEQRFLPWKPWGSSLFFALKVRPRT